MPSVRRSRSFSHLHSNCEDNGRILRRVKSLNYVITSLFHLLCTSTTFPPGLPDQCSGNVERGAGVGGPMQLPFQPAAARGGGGGGGDTDEDSGRGDGGGTQLAGTIVENHSHTIDTQASSGRSGPANSASGGGATPNPNANPGPDPQIIGMQVVKILIVPIVIGVMGGLSQLVVGSQKADSTQKLLLYVCGGISLTTAVLAIVLIISCSVRWINNPRRDCIIWLMIVAVFCFIFVDLCVFIIFLLIVMRSKAD